MNLPPLPIASSFDDEYGSYTDYQMTEYGQACREALKADLAEALCNDCENGVKWLNEQAVEKFKRDFPNLWELMK